MPKKPFLCRFIDQITTTTSTAGPYADFRSFLTGELGIFKPTEKISEKLILILTDRSDPESNYIVTGLMRRGIDYVRINIEDIPDLLRIRYGVGDDKNKDSNIKFIVEGREIDVAKDISVVYLRQFDIQSSSLLHGEWDDKLSQMFSFEQWKDAYKILETALKKNNKNCIWVNDPDRSRLAAENRILQLSVAKAVGFHIPKTIITNDPQMARDFYNANNGRIVIKALHHHNVQVGNRIYSMYTHAVTDEDLLHLDDDGNSSLVSAPCILQEKIDKKSDLRITVAGKKVFSVEIDSQSTSRGKDDLHRCPLNELPKRIIELKKTDKEKCIKLVESLGLKYGAIDLVRAATATSNGDDTDDLIFLEINPTGDWLWLEQDMTRRRGEGSLPITEAIIDLLVQKNKKKGESRKKK